MVTTYYLPNCSLVREELLSSARRNYLLVVVYCIYFIIGFFGNGALVILFMTKKNLRDVNNALITNLALSDFLYVGLFIPIVVFTEFYRFRPFGKTFCIISILTNYTSQDVSTLSLTALSYFRYRVVVKPFKSRTDSRTSLVGLFCLFSWMIGAATAVLPTLYCEEHPRQECLVWSRHIVQVFQENEKFLKYFWIRFAFLFLLPFFIITFFYGRLAYTLSCTYSLLGNSRSAQACHQAKQRKKLSVIVLIIIIMFFVCWIPTYVYWLTGLDDTYFIYWLNTARHVTMFLPATLNPTILLLTSSVYRKSFLTVCVCRNVKLRFTAATSTILSRVRSVVSHVTRQTDVDRSPSLEMMQKGMV
ncbi:Neuropeptide CCHamide-1 receptor [Holothuria leucospilota]|uniref:Neuropeptide CCHamide-1 receptor n=1 Tax=Holothuria leucospilota TaxID=206669 RepID=A0A9Q1H507_HOLLE|nr:Neuropeptide CCHamide-1 receptor [Holothuria leucospilota]